MRGLLAGGGRLAGLIYSGRIWVRIFSRFGSGIDLPDRPFYALIPILGYLAATISSVALLMEAPWAPDLMAVALIALIVAGIRNAWDMTVGIVMRSNNRESHDGGDSASQSREREHCRSLSATSPMRPSHRSASSSTAMI
jgi:hypothetical protein